MRGNPLKDGRPHAAAGAATFRPTPADTLLLRSLAYKASYFARKGMLADDGSFFYDDERLAKENMVTAKTVMRSKRRLKEAGKIKFEPGKHKGQATKYWILAKDDFLSSLHSNPEPDNLSAKHDILSVKAGQNVTPNNLINKKIDSFSKRKMTEDQERERHNAFQDCIRSLKQKHG